MLSFYNMIILSLILTLCRQTLLSCVVTNIPSQVYLFLSVQVQIQTIESRRKNYDAWWNLYFGMFIVYV